MLIRVLKVANERNDIIWRDNMESAARKCNRGSKF